MTGNNMTNLHDIADEYGLSYVETTTERSGYPSHIKGALIDFKNFQQAEEVAQKYGLTIKEFRKNDGWQLWYRCKGEMFEPFQRSIEDYGDNYTMWEVGDEEEFFDVYIRGQLTQCESLENAEDILKYGKEIYEKIQDLEEGQAVITSDGRYYETISKQSMRYYYDTHHYAIGVMEND